MSNWPRFPPAGIRTETVGADTSDSAGTTMSDGGTFDTKGSYAEIIASTTFDSDFMLLTLGKLEASAVSFIIDIAIGASGVEEVICPNIVHSPHRDGDICIIYPLHVAISSDARISARCQSSSGARDMDVTVTLFAGGFNFPPGKRGTEAIGSDTANSKGTVVDAGGSANTKGTWVELIAATDNDIDELLMITGANENTAHTSNNKLIDIAIGASGSEQIIVGDIRNDVSSAIDHPTPPLSGPIPVNIPAGTRVAVRSQCTLTDATDRLMDVSLIGLIQ